MNIYARVALAAVAVIALGAFGLAVLRPDQGAVGGGPGPSPTPSPAPTATPSGTVQRTTMFRQPFSYVLPAAVEFDLGPDYGPTYFEVRVPEFADAGKPSGVMVQAIGGGRIDPCVVAPTIRPIAAGPQAVIDYLKTIPALAVTEESAASVGGLPARQATVRANSESATCPEVWPWAEGGPESMPGGTDLRIVAVDVGGEHIVLTVYGEAVNPAWATMADELIGSIQFEAAAASPLATPAAS